MKQIKLLHILLIILAISCCIFIYNFQTGKFNLSSIGLHAPLKQTKEIAKTIEIKYNISPECPKGTDKMIKDSKVKVEYETIKCGLSDDKYLYYGEEIKVWYATYGSKLVGGDVQLGKSIHLLQKSNGDLFLDFGLARLKDEIVSYAGEMIDKKIGASGDPISYSIHELERYFKLQGLIYGPNDKGQYCGNFDTLPPHVGTLTVCQGIGGEYESIDKFRIISGIPIYLEAKEIARDKARSLYLDKVEYKNPVSNSMSQAERDKLGTKTYLADYIIKWRYHSSGSGYWLFVIRERENSVKFSPSSKLKGFDDMVLVKVQNDKKVCILETTPYAIRLLSVNENEASCK